MKTHGGKRHSSEVRATSRSPVSVPADTASTTKLNDVQRISPQWTWHYGTLSDLRDRLLQAHAEHVSEVAHPVETLGVDSADAARETEDRDVLWAELGAEDDQLFEIDCALQRIRDGVYGRCEQTGLPISSERLRAIPWTRYCRSAAAQREAGQSRKIPRRL